MNVYALHQGIQYHVEELATGVWRWSFTTPTGKLRTGRVIGERLWAAAVACRAIEVWQQCTPHTERLRRQTWQPTHPPVMDKGKAP
jgi:hypothetical protein